MRNPLRSDSAANLGLLLARLPMGAFFLIAGIGKIRGGVENFASSVYGAVPPWAPHELGRGYVHAVPYLEVTVGLLLVLGLLGRLGGLIGALMVISFTIAVTGVTDKSLPFQPNLIYIGLLLAIFLLGPGRISLDGLMFGRRRGASAA